MKYNELNATPNTAKKRVGRGNGSGHGTTAGRGTKGQLARTGKKLSATFMGGQGPLVRRVPKLKGFTSMRVPSQVVYLDQLSAFKNKTADNESLFEAGLISTPHHSTKIIVRGELKEKVTVKVQAASANAIQAIEKAGGSFEKVTVPLKKKQK